MVTIYDMLSELETWFPLTSQERAKAIASTVNNHNNLEFNHLVAWWRRGLYDESPEILHQELLMML
jgi:hypothetical protein